MKNKEVILNHDYTFKVKGKGFYCPCGCNVFRYKDKTGKYIKCNACDNVFECE